MVFSADWKPFWNILDGRFELLLVNPRELKQFPGRKSDVKDCQWIAQLLQHGLLRSSFVPERPQRQLRDLTRHRAQLQGERSRVANRIHKLLEDANIKLGSVASDILGVSGREMLEHLAKGEQDVVKMAKMARGPMRPKIPQLQLALEGCFDEPHRFMLRQLLGHLDHLGQQVAEFNLRIEAAMVPFVDPELKGKLDAIPGVNQTISSSCGSTRQKASARRARSHASDHPLPRHPKSLRLSRTRRRLFSLPGTRATQALLGQTL